MIRMNQKKGKKRLLCLLLAAILLCTANGIAGLTASAATTPTSLGLAEHGIKAHRDGWKYSYGGKGQTVGSGESAYRISDCAGLIYAYFSDCGALGNMMGSVTAQVKNNCAFSNSISEGIPRIHGLVLTMPDFNAPDTGIYGHIGIYIGNNEVTDNSDSYYNMRRDPVIGSSRKWNAWHLVDNGAQYPVEGWYALDGKMVHYTNYEYDVNTTIDGYTIGSDGYAYTADQKPAPVNASLLSTKYASASQVAALLRTRYSGKDDTYEILYGSGNGDSPAPQLGYNGTITGDGVNLRKEPTTKSAVVATLPKNTQVNILSEKQGEAVSHNGSSSKSWYAVTTASGASGYVSAFFAEHVSTAPTISSAAGYVTITTEYTDGSVYYTTDGTEPNKNSDLYTGPLYNMTGFTYRAVVIQGDIRSDEASATVLTNGSIFTDFTASNWYFGAVDKAVAAGIFQGNGNGVFAPDKNITRAQFVMALANLDGADLSAYDGTSFTDLNGLTASMKKAVAWAAEKGYVSGFSPESFRPNQSITREQMCSIMARYADLSLSEEPVPFADDSAISSWAKTAVYACREAKLIDGIGDNRFSPRGTATRAQACVVTTNLYDNR